MKEGSAAEQSGGSLTSQRELDRKVQLCRQIADHLFLPELSVALDFARSYAEVQGPDALDALVSTVLLVDQDQRTAGTTRRQRRAGRVMVRAMARLYCDRLGGFVVAGRMFDLYATGAENPRNFKRLVALGNRVIYGGRINASIDELDEEIDSWT